MARKKTCISIEPEVLDRFNAAVRRAGLKVSPVLATLMVYFCELEDAEKTPDDQIPLQEQP